MSSNRVTNTHCISSDDESVLILSMNLRKEGSIPKKGPSSFSFMSPIKENSFVVSCLESLK